MYQFIGLNTFGMHQGAQSDRASIALNYFQYSMNFFEPRVMENRNFYGITGMEFPIIPYTVAILYKLLGFNPALYRLIEAGIFLLGQWSVWKISALFIPKISHRLLFNLLWISSPILIFYSANFLPEVPALSFSLFAWYQFFNYYYHIEKRQSLVLFTLFSTLAALIKITYFIPLIALLSIILIQKKTTFPPIPDPKKIFFSILITITLVISWYGYAKYLTDLTYNQHFLQKINPSQNFTELIENSRYALNTWIDSFYPRRFMILFLLIWIFTLQKNFRNISLLGLLSLLLFLGFLGIFFLFNKQFRYHDYYFISAIPFVVFMGFYIYEQHLSNKQVFTGLIGILILIGLYISPFLNASHTRKLVKASNTKGDYYCQNILDNTKDFNNARQFLDSNWGKGELIVAFDPSPNTFLYYLQRQGIRLAPDFDEALSIGIIQTKINEKSLATKNIIINKYFNYPEEHYIHRLIEGKPIYQQGEIWIFSLNQNIFKF